MASQIPALPQSYAPGMDSVFSDQSGFYSLDSNIPGLSKVILDKLKMKDYGEYRYFPQIMPSKCCTDSFQFSDLISTHFAKHVAF